jgi:hypothetical protein
MNRTICIVISICAVCLGGQSDTAAGTNADAVEAFLGVGAGFQSGTGIHGGVRIGAYWTQLGVGLYYAADDARLFYSVGLRGARDLLQGRFLNSYAWTGVGVAGRSNTDAGDGTYSVSPGLGIGMEFHFGIPFHFKVDTGYRFHYDSGRENKGVQIKPTVNGSITYHW